VPSASFGKATVVAPARPGSARPGSLPRPPVVRRSEFLSTPHDRLPAPQRLGSGVRAPDTGGRPFKDSEQALAASLAPRPFMYPVLLFRVQVPQARPVIAPPAVIGVSG